MSPPDGPRAFTAPAGLPLCSSCTIHVSAVTEWRLTISFKCHARRSDTAPRLFTAQAELIYSPGARCSYSDEWFPSSKGQNPEAQQMNDFIK